ncbi:hypothetical protein CCYA_CCYA09G2547 [Cyanidiococcus yangmingshanensis]|nr:hypothetical protein CCYA_CCYA09G2547 [Cyanidiococcus yangmingshanensis]
MYKKVVFVYLPLPKRGSHGVACVGARPGRGVCGTPGVSSRSVLLPNSFNSSKKQQRWIGDVCENVRLERLRARRVRLEASAARKPFTALPRGAYSREGQVLRAWAGVVTLFAIDRSLLRVFAMARIRFPSSLAGMLVLFLSLLVADRIRSWPLSRSPEEPDTLVAERLPCSVASVVSSWASPGLSLMTRWLAIFFVPNLIMLPAAAVPRGSALLRLVIAIGFGLVMSLFSTILFVSFLERVSRRREVRNVDGSPLEPATALERIPKGASIPGIPLQFQRESDSVSSVAPKASSGPQLALIGIWAMVWAASTLGWIFGTGMTADGRATALWLSLLSSTVVGFSLGQRLPTKFQKALHPLLTCVILTYLSMWLLAKGSSSTWNDILLLYMRRPGKQWPPHLESVANIAAESPVFILGGPGNVLLSFLGPAVLSFAFQMYQRRQFIREKAIQVLGGCLLAAFFGMLASALLARVLCLPAALRLVFVPRSITAPLAIAMADMLECDATLTATIVVITGLLGANFGRLLMDLWRPVVPQASSPVARGLAMGASAHGLGTAAISEEPEAFPFAAIAMALVGTLSALMVTLPAFRTLLGIIAGVRMS